MAERFSGNPASSFNLDQLNEQGKYYQDDKDLNRNSKPSQDIDILLLECQSYMNWIYNHITMTEDNIKRQIDRIQRK